MVWKLRFSNSIIMITDTCIMINSKSIWIIIILTSPIRQFVTVTKNLLTRNFLVDIIYNVNSCEYKLFVWHGSRLISRVFLQWNTKIIKIQIQNVNYKCEKVCVLDINISMSRRLLCKSPGPMGRTTFTRSRECILWHFRTDCLFLIIKPKATPVKSLSCTVLQPCLF